MNEHSYTAEQLRTNRTSLLLFGGTQDDRRHWAEEAAEQFPGEGNLVVVDAPAQLAAVLARAHGVVFVPDVGALAWPVQARLTQCLLRQEERAKWVLGLSSAPQRALDQGLLRPDLWFRLRVAQVDAASAEVQQHLKRRRARPKPVEPTPPASLSRAKVRPPKKVRRSG